MKHFFIIPNRAKDPDLSITQGITDYLETHGATCTIRALGDADPHGRRKTDPEEIPEDTECMIVLGGDGTLMRAADDTVDRQIPLLGINLGTLGYLAEIDRTSIYPALNALLSDQFTIEHRMMLHGDVVRDGEIAASRTALNEVVIGRVGTPHVLALYNYVNDAYLNDYRADGVIVSTPTGSTGYSLSVGGPIISPSANVFLLTPLAAHTLNTRSVVLPPENKITVQVGPGRDNSIEHANAYFDGDEGIPMQTGDKIEIRRSEKDTLIIKIKNDSFLEVLRRKMGNI